MIQCSYWWLERSASSAAWNEGSCLVTSGDGKSIYDVLRPGVLANTYCDSLGGSCTAPTTTVKYDRYSHRVSGKFFQYQSQYASKPFMGCATLWQIGGADMSKCTWATLPVDLNCVNTGVLLADAHPISFGLAILFGSLAFF